MRIGRLVLGTNNPGKLKEWARILEQTVKVIGPSEFGELPEPQEGGSTFEENARQKAIHYAKLTGEYVLSEDGGYEVDALGGAPGVRSRRILPGGREGTDQELIDYVLEKLEGLPPEGRTVNLTVAAALADPDGNIIYEDRERFQGIVSERPGSVMIPGYPFRSIHYIPELGKTYAELTDEEHEKYSHKRKIAKRLIDFLNE